MHVTPTPLEDLGAKIKAARIAQRYDVRGAASAAQIARDTWKKIENGESVHDTKRAAATQLLGLDWNGEPIGGEAPAKVAPTEASNVDSLVLREVQAMRAEQAALVDRVTRLEQVAGLHMRRVEKVEEAVAFKGPVEPPDDFG